MELNKKKYRINGFKKHIYSAGILVLLLGCNYVSKSVRYAQSQDTYFRLKNGFEPCLTAHFPDKIEGETHASISSKNKSKYDVGLYLYEYDVNLSLFKDLKKRIEKQSIAHYRGEDSILFILNRFETMKTNDEMLIPEVSDSAYLDSTLFIGLYPIPNFIDYKNPINRNGM